MSLLAKKGSPCKPALVFGLRCAARPLPLPRLSGSEIPSAFSIQLHLLLHHLPALKTLQSSPASPCNRPPCQPAESTDAAILCVPSALSLIRLAPRRNSSSDPPSLAPYRLRQKKTLKAPAAPLLSPTRDLFFFFLRRHRRKPSPEPKGFKSRHSVTSIRVYDAVRLNQGPFP